MKKPTFGLMILLGVICLAGCGPLVHHADPFYNFSRNDFPRDHLPLIDPIEATRESPSSPWELHLANVLWIDVPSTQEEYPYAYVQQLEKFSVKDGVIMAYSPYLDKEANPYVLNGFYHWFVMVPAKNITVGFHTEDEFRQYIETLGVQNPDWQLPDEAFDRFAQTGCLYWIPDCK